MKSLLEYLLCTIVFLSLPSIGGILFGYGANRPVCMHMRRQELTNLEYYLMPVARYACEQNFGILQPYTDNFVSWLQMVHMQE